MVRKRTRRPQLWAWERTALGMGFKIVASVDEVGLGPLAGPVVAGAAVLPIGARLPGLDDSKKLNHAQRLSLDRRIRRHAVQAAIVVVGIEDLFGEGSGRGGAAGHRARVRRLCARGCRWWVR